MTGPDAGLEALKAEVARSSGLGSNAGTLLSGTTIDEVEASALELRRFVAVRRVELQPDPRPRDPITEALSAKAERREQLARMFSGRREPVRDQRGRFAAGFDGGARRPAVSLALYAGGRPCGGRPPTRACARPRRRLPRAIAEVGPARGTVLSPSAAIRSDDHRCSTVERQSLVLFHLGRTPGHRGTPMQPRSSRKTIRAHARRDRGGTRSAVIASRVYTPDFSSRGCTPSAHTLRTRNKKWRRGAVRAAEVALRPHAHWTPTDLGRIITVS